MIVDPTAFVQAVSSNVAPIPSIVPGVEPVYQKATDIGKRTLW